jgi:hypothetical protein
LVFNAGFFLPLDRLSELHDRGTQRSTDGGEARAEQKKGYPSDGGNLVKTQCECEHSNLLDEPDGASLFRSLNKVYEPQFFNGKEKQGVRLFPNSFSYRQLGPTHPIIHFRP